MALGQATRSSPARSAFAATANTILLVGARPVFVDIDPKTYNIDPVAGRGGHHAAHQSDHAGASLWQPGGYGPALPLAEQHGLTVIEDAAQAILATVHGKPAGSFGTGCFSLYATKNMTTGEGGMVTTDDATLAEHLRQWRSHGQKQRYVQTGIGYNYRMMSIAGGNWIGADRQSGGLDRAAHRQRRLSDERLRDGRADADGAA